MLNSHVVWSSRILAKWPISNGTSYLTICWVQDLELELCCRWWGGSYYKEWENGMEITLMWKYLFTILQQFILNMFPLLTSIKPFTTRKALIRCMNVQCINMHTRVSQTQRPPGGKGLMFLLADLGATESHKSFMHAWWFSFHNYNQRFQTSNQKLSC